MRLLGHHIALPSVLLALLDGCLFLAALYLVGIAGTCERCYLHSVAHLKVYEALLLDGVFLLIIAAVGLYNRDALLDFRLFTRRFVLATQFVFIPSVAAVAVAKTLAGLPFGWFVGILSLAIALFFSVLFLVRSAILWVFDLAFLKRRVLVIGSGTRAQAVVDFINHQGSGHLRCVSHINNGRTAQNVLVSRGSAALQAVVDVPPTPLLVIAQSFRAEEIVVAANDKRGLPMWQLLECKLHGISVTEFLTFWERETGQIDLETTGPGWLAFSEGFRLHLPRRIVKRLIDIVVSFTFLAVAFPAGLLVALLIKMDSKGPVFYKQERTGQNGRIFRIWKFRSMSLDAEKDGPRWARETDARVTRVGKFIRRPRIDEIPQVINVLKGDMSFIGPRPERPYFVDRLHREIPLYDLRHRVQPGITGWAQVNYPYGASIEDAKRKLAYDLYYVKNHDAVLDLVILLQTVRVILFSQGGR